MRENSRVYVAGHRGMVGSAIMRRLERDGYRNLVVRTHDDLDLTEQSAVRAFFESEKIDVVIVAAARVGGIYANSTYPASFIYENLAIETNLIHQSFLHGVRSLLFLGSSCIYPRDATQPMEESALLSGPLEATNEPYAVAKIAGVKLCESYNRQYGVDYRSLMPTNLYGPNDNFHPQNSHVIPALIRRFHEAKTARADRVAIWGSGRPRREFLHVDDLAAACLRVLTTPREALDALVSPMMSHINVGSGTDVTIAELASLISNVVGFQGRIDYDPSKPDGTPQKLLDVGKMKSLGWTPQFDLESGLRDTYAWFVESSSTAS